MANETWIIDSQHIVHVPYCRAVADPDFVTPYTVKIPNDGAMAVHLARPEVRDGHRGPSMIKACPLCVNLMITEETLSG